jgi:hypothetical protein
LGVVKLRMGRGRKVESHNDKRHGIPVGEGGAKPSCFSVSVGIPGAAAAHKDDHGE